MSLGDFLVDASIALFFGVVLAMAVLWMQRRFFPPRHRRGPAP